MCPILTHGAIAVSRVGFVSTQACRGSVCALWDPRPAAHSRNETLESLDRPAPVPAPMGRCGLGKGANFEDPAHGGGEA